MTKPKKTAKTAAAEIAALEAAVSQIEAYEDQTVHETEAKSEPKTSSSNNFEEIAKSFSNEDVQDTVARIGHELSERTHFEELTDPENANIHRTLKKVRGSLERSHAARVMLAACLSPSFINRTLMEGSRFNVYSLDKVADIIDGLAGSYLANKINRAIVPSLFKVTDAGYPFSNETAKAAASDKIRVSPELERLLTRHTVSASTAPTQVSSTMNALEVLGIVKINGSRKNATYQLLDTPQARHLRKVCEAQGLL